MLEYVDVEQVQVFVVICIAIVANRVDLDNPRRDKDGGDR